MTNEQITVNGIKYNVIVELNPQDFPNILREAGENLVRIVGCQRPRGHKLARFYGFQTKDGIRWQ